MIIDAHGHIGRFNDKWWGLERLKRFCSHEVNRIYVSNISIIHDGMEDATEELIKVVNEDTSNFLFGLIWCDPFDKNWKILINQAIKKLKKRFVGLKIHPTLGKYKINKKNLLDPIFKFSEFHKIPIFAHCDEKYSHPTKYLGILQKHPKTPLVLYHAEHKGIEEMLEKKDYFPNLYVEASFCHSSRVRRIINKFGSKSIIFGTDAPLWHRSPYEVILKVYRDVLDEEEQKYFFYKNVLNLCPKVD